VTPGTERGTGRIRRTQQPRARETVERLLAAAQRIVERDGFDAATVPAIAAEAGVAVGTVYKRFPDKDALIRSLFVQFFERSRAANREALDPTHWTGCPAATIVARVADGMVSSYHRHRRLLSGLLGFAETHADPRFRRIAREMSEEGLRGLETLLLTRRDEIGHERPDEAVRFGLLVFGISLRGLLLRDHPPAHAFSKDPARLRDELTRTLLAYLDVARTTLPRRSSALPVARVRRALGDRTNG
jgi:AcrR family transcriptional regulator